MLGKVIFDVCEELARAEVIHPEWPTDPLHALAILNEEVGEVDVEWLQLQINVLRAAHGRLGKAVLQQVDEPEKNVNGLDDVRKEAIHTAAMALRFLVNFDKYMWEK